LLLPLIIAVGARSLKTPNAPTAQAGCLFGLPDLALTLHLVRHIGQSNLKLISKATSS